MGSHYLIFVSSLIVLLPYTLADISNFTEFYNEVQELLATFETYQTLVNNNKHFISSNKTSNQTNNPKSPLDYGEYDFIIVGAGTGGGIVANRLTEKNYSVLLVEAGSKDPDTVACLGLGTLFFRTEYNWGYNTTPQKNACLASKNQQCVFPTGKMLGGTSSINGGAYVRGSAKDYDYWEEELGNYGWSYEKILKYFKKAERALPKTNIDRGYHGLNGPQSISFCEDTPGLTSTILEGFREIGSLEIDFNGKSQYGVGRFQEFLDGNIRTGTAHAYITPASQRSNLFISTNSLVTRVNINNGRAKGIDFVKNGIPHRARATKEVIVSAGAINTPQLLMLSGIGPASELNKHGIKLIKDLPVGKNLQDHVHVMAPIHFRTNHTFYNFSLEEQIQLWYQAKRPLTPGWGAQTITFINSENNTDNKPDLEFIALGPPAIAGSYGTMLEFNEEYSAIYNYLNGQSDFAFLITLLHPVSKGEITLKSKNPRDYPLINPNYFDDERDLETMYQGIKRIGKIAETKAFKNFKAEPYLLPTPGCDNVYEKDSREWWYCFLNHLGAPAFHPIGTARMGRCSTDSVVSPELKVHGIEGLRVVDASVLPTHISGHPNAVIVMIAEKASDLIKADHNI